MAFAGGWAAAAAAAESAFFFFAAAEAAGATDSFLDENEKNRFNSINLVGQDKTKRRKSVTSLFAHLPSFSCCCCLASFLRTSMKLE